MDIGAKLRAARQKSAMTQEQAAEQLGVSRQTVSNWENNRTYPDIISVVRMSDLYAISLDALLKEEEKTMSDYTEYLAQQTDTVQSKKRLTKTIQIGIYLVVWAAIMLIYVIGCVRLRTPEDINYGMEGVSRFTIRSGGINDSLFDTLTMIAPVLLLTLTAVLSYLIGGDRSWDKRKWLISLFFGGMFGIWMFATEEMSTWMQVTAADPNRGQILRLMICDLFTVTGQIAAVSLVFLVIGALTAYLVRRRQQKKQAQ